jgi:Cft2 family RNA processing exonuclease
VGDLSVTLLPAGHILGSAMAMLEGAGGRVLYPGDVRPEGGLTCPPAEPVRADVLIMEATFGRPEHRFPPAEETRRELVRFAREALEEGATPVFLAYALGKAQEVMTALCLARVPVAAHAAVWGMCDVYRSFGHRFLGSRRLAGRGRPGAALVVPPQSRREVRVAGALRVAAVTGWGDRAKGPGVERVFRLSDHADYDGLLGIAAAVGAKRVHVVHGYAPEFAKDLRARGFDAEAVEGHRGPEEDERPGLF